MKRVLILFLVISGCKTTAKDYKVGDCLNTGIRLYKVTEVGKYSIKALSPYYDGYQMMSLDQNDIESSVRADCFDYFDYVGPIVKERKEE